MSRIRRKWRPILALVIGGTLAAVLLAPMVGLVVVKFLWGYMRYRYAALLVGGGVWLVTAVLGWLLWRLILRPVQRLSAESRAFAAGEAERFDPQAHYGTRELQELGQTVLDMAESLHNRQETLHTYTSYATHELKSPLTALIGTAERWKRTGCPRSSGRSCWGACSSRRGGCRICWKGCGRWSRRANRWGRGQARWIRY